jgi:hypothetical protein
VIIRLSIYLLFALLILAITACKNSDPNGAGSSSGSVKTFETLNWKATPEAERFVFVDDIVRSNILIGKTKAEIIELLGKPSSTSEEPPEDSLTYVVKVGGRGFDKVYFLDIRFEKKKISTRVFLRGD